jgi:hypothetical protein
MLIRIKNADPEERDVLLSEFSIHQGSVLLQRRPPSFPEVIQIKSTNDQLVVAGNGIDGAEEFDCSSPDDVLGACAFVSADEQEELEIFGPTLGLHNSVKEPEEGILSSEEARNALIANAVVQRQKEYDLSMHSDFDGVPAELAVHLLELHWNRQHHASLLTYRPAFTRDLMHGGQYYSRFLLNAIFAAAAEYSDRLELRDDPSDPTTTGGRFFRRCKELLIEDSPLEHSSIPTIVGLLLLGSTFIARGETTKGWNHTGMATRMVYDLGLNLDVRKPGLNVEDIEVRRRVFWGAFVYDKLQSLHMGRPVAIQLRDSQVSLDFLDTMEELELWSPYIDPKFSAIQLSQSPIPIYSISTFHQFCTLSKLITRIINRFYFIGAKATNSETSLQALDDDLLSWYDNLPPFLTFQPWSEVSSLSEKRVAPNIMLLHTTYHYLVILLHRPFISDGRFRSTRPTENSWHRCTKAAIRITSILNRFKELYTLRKAPYLIGYAAYLACTIHVRNGALPSGGNGQRMARETLNMLDELIVGIPGIASLERMIRDLIRGNGIIDKNSLFYSSIYVFPVLLVLMDLLLTNYSPVTRQCDVRH